MATKVAAMAVNRLGFMVFAVLFGLWVVPSHAFLNDTSNQKVVFIGKGGAENMQQIRVNNIETPPPVYSQQQNNMTIIPAYRNTESESYIRRPASQATPPAPTAIRDYQNDGSTYGTTNYSSAYANSYASDYNKTYGSDFNFANSASALVIDRETGEVLYSKNVDAVRSIASISKIMTAMVVIDSGQSMSDELIVKGSDLVGAKKASSRLKKGDRMTRSDFMLMMLMKSENPAAKTLASNYFDGYDAFIVAMNQKAASLGMNQTSFRDASGLSPQNRSSAQDLVKMVKEVATNPRYADIRIFSATPQHDFFVNNYQTGTQTLKLESTNRLVRSHSYPIAISKTGYIKESGYCVVMETYINQRPTITVLLGAPNSNDRWQDAETLFRQLALR